MGEVCLRNVQNLLVLVYHRSVLAETLTVHVIVIMLAVDCLMAFTGVSSVKSFKWVQMISL